jgi:solute carrier family 35 protein E1
MDTVQGLCIVLWYGASVFAISTSKLAMQQQRVPLTLCAAQFCVAAFGSRIVLLIRGVRGEQLVLNNDLWRVLKIAVAYTSGFLFTNLAFSIASAPFVETVKASEPITTVILAILLLGERERAMTYGALVPIVVGVAAATSSDSSFSATAMAAVLASNFCFSARSVFAKQLKREAPHAPSSTDPVVLFYHISRLGLVLLVPLAGAVEGLGLVRAATWTHDDAFGSRLTTLDLQRFIATLVLNGVCYTVYNQMSFCVLNRVTTTSTHAVLNVFRRVVVILATSAYFAKPLARSTIQGVAVAVVGFLAFTWSKAATKAKSA